LPDGESEIFFAEGLDRRMTEQMTDLPVGQITPSPIVLKARALIDFARTRRKRLGEQVQAV
jgi:hypothetical protein